MTDIAPEEIEEYKKLVRVFNILNRDDNKELLEMITDLRDDIIARLSRVKDEEIYREQGKLQILNNLVNYRNRLLESVKYYESMGIDGEDT